MRWSEVKLQRWALVALGGVALLLRVWDLGRLPLFVDEAYTGYDAVSVLETGRDMWGVLLPVYFQSWGGDALEGLYRYLCLPFVALLGPLAIAVRLPAALVGTLTVVLTFFAGRRLLGTPAGWIAAVLLAVSPWHLAFSRVGFRGILLPAMTIGLVWACTAAAGVGRPSRPRPELWLLAAFLAGLGLYTYSIAKLFVPAIGLLLLWQLRHAWWHHRRRALLAAALLLVLALPAIRATWTGSGQVRFRQISVFAPREVARSAARLRRDHPDSSLAEWAARSKTRTVAWSVLSNYLAHFHPRFLLTEGDDNLRHSAPGVGQLFWAEGILLCLGLVHAIRRRSVVDRILIGWVLIAPLGASLTNDRIPNALRTLVALPALQLLAASGAVALGGWLFARAGRRAVAAMGIALGAALFLNSAWAQLDYFQSYAEAAAPYWNAGYPRGIQRLYETAPPEAPLLVARPSDADVSRYSLNPYVHSLILFYGRIPPAEFQAQGSLGRAQVVRLPAFGPISRDDFPAGAWGLIPARRAVPGEVVEWIDGPGGEPLMAIVPSPAGG